MNVPSRGIHSCRTTSPESCRSILSESVNENRERLKKCHTFQYGLKTSVVLFRMVSKNCLLFQLMKQKSVYSNQEKTKISIHFQINSVVSLINDVISRIISVVSSINDDDLEMDAAKSKYLSRSEDVFIVMKYRILSFQKKATNK